MATDDFWLDEAETIPADAPILNGETHTISASAWGAGGAGGFSGGGGAGMTRWTTVSTSPNDNWYVYSTGNFNMNPVYTSVSANPDGTWNVSAEFTKLEEVEKEWDD